ncbi:MAG: ParB/RepB/Spo0J family partition protein [Kineosporiaceae bacterium]
MSEKRRGLGRGLGALIPSGTTAVRPTPGDRPVDVFFPGPESDSPTVEQREAVEAEAPPADAPSGEPTASTEAPAAPSTETADPETPAASDSEVDAWLHEPSTPPVATEQAPEQAAEPAPEPVRPVALDDGGLVPVPGATFAELPVGEIRPNSRQPRQVFDEEQLAELVHSIREIGVLQPVVVRARGSEGDGYELVMGERRWRAAQEAGLERIPAIIRETNDDVMLRDALLENLHRAQLNPLEEAAAYQQLLDDFGCTHDELAQRIGRSRPQISNTIRLMKLPALVQRRVAAGVLSAGHARALLGLEDPAAMERLAQRVVAEGLSVRAVEEIVALGDEVRPKKAVNKPRPGGHQPELDAVASRLGDRLDTKVTIALGRSKGKLSVEFASVEDLNRILSVLAPGDPGAFREN